jgi:penicillin-binding protein 1A
MWVITRQSFLSFVLARFPYPMKSEKDDQNVPFSKRLLKMFLRLSLIAFSFFFLILLALVIYVGVNLPPMAELENPQLDLSTQIYSADGALLGNIYNSENRIFTPLNEISTHVVDALVATEDVRFFDHSGVDGTALIAVMKDRILHGRSRGGSTLTMQLSRNLYRAVGKDDSFLRKIKEMVVSTIVERRFTKEEILQGYLNTSCFFRDTYGIEMGSRTLFGKKANELEIQEAALLVGMLKGPTQYDPVYRPEKSLARRNTVIDQMVKYQKLTADKGEELKKLPLGLKYSRGKNPTSTLAPYFRDHVRRFLRDWAKGKNIDLYRDGLKVYTTIDSRMQGYAEKAVEEHLRELQKQLNKELANNKPWVKEPSMLDKSMKESQRFKSMTEAGASNAEIKKAFNQKEKMRVWTWEGERDTTLTPMDSLIHYIKFLETGFLAMDPFTGEIRAWVGGINYKHFQYDHVADGRRQVGSTFKPIVYAAAFDEGRFEPCNTVLDIPVAIELPDGKIWSPKNSGGGDEGLMNYMEALAKSKNQVTACLMKNLGPELICQYARELGVESPLNCVPSLCLGTSDLTVMEMTRVYCAFANYGYKVKPFFVARIEDKNGQILAEFVPEKNQAIDSSTAYIMARMLMNVVDHPSGTAHRLRTKYHFKNPMGGKTGTTQNNTDGWFMGITPHLVAGAWVGGADNRIRFSSTAYGQGANMALPIWAIFFKYVYADKKNINLPMDDFKPPSHFKGNLSCPAPGRRDDDNSIFSPRDDPDNP